MGYVSQITLKNGIIVGPNFARRVSKDEVQFSEEEEEMTCHGPFAGLLENSD